MSVATLLATSRRAHDQYRRLHADSHNNNLLEQAAAIQTALLARLDAEDADPDHVDPAWIADTQAMKGQASPALIAFYGRYLAPAGVGAMQAISDA